MKTRLHCPCDEYLHANDEDELVEFARDHLAEAHPDRQYTRDEILQMAT